MWDKMGGGCCLSTVRCRANVVYTRQSRPDSVLGFQVEILKTIFFSRVKGLKIFQEDVLKIVLFSGESP